MQLSKAKISYLNSLQQKKFRQKYNNFLVEGDKSAVELLQFPNAEIELICATQDWSDNHSSLTLPHRDKLVIVKLNELKKISSLRTPNGVLIVAKQFSFPDVFPDAEQSFSLFLDNIQDPGNMGTILRIADWFGLPYVFRSKGCADVYNSKVIQASMGAFMRVKSPIIDLAELKRQVPGLPIYGALMEGENMYSLPKTERGILVIGNEGKGISTETQGLLTKKITIPAPAGSGAESLNAGVAAGIIVSQLLKI